MTLLPLSKITKIGQNLGSTTVPEAHGLRRSARLNKNTVTRSYHSNNVDKNEELSKLDATKNTKTSQRSLKKRKSLAPKSETQGEGKLSKDQKKKLDILPETSRVSKYSCLPRTREIQLQRKFKKNISGNGSIDAEKEKFIVFGVDEAGRGPLCGPVVAAAAYVPIDLKGIVDSKKITKEEDREALYESIVSSDHPDVRWAVAVIDASRIDEINILQATMEAMRMASEVLVTNISATDFKKAKQKNIVKSNNNNLRIVKVASASEQGCYVVCGPLVDKVDNRGETKDESRSIKLVPSDTKDTYFALVDGNRCPESMPCEAEAIVKGDSKEYCIAAASILAKVTRDRLMHEYDALYPQYNLKQHKGYPTKAHMDAIMIHGASPQHRLTFKPLKDMSFDDQGNIIPAES